MSVKFLEVAVEWETTPKDYSKSKDFTVQRLKLLMASHNISFILLIDKEFESTSVVKNVHLMLFYFSMCFACFVKVRKNEIRQEKRTNIHFTYY